jgi:hypothetical protein
MSGRVELNHRSNGVTEWRFTLGSRRKRIDCIAVK